MNFWSELPQFFNALSYYPTHAFLFAFSGFLAFRLLFACSDFFFDRFTPVTPKK